MADEVTTSQELGSPESSDPIEAVMRSHMSRMQQIADEQNDKTKQLCDDIVTTIRRNSGVKSAVLDKVLSVMGIDPPRGNNSQATGETPIE